MIVQANESPVAIWSFDNVETNKVEVKMVRGETFLPREVFHYVEENISGTKSELTAKYHKVVQGVKGKALLLDGFTSFIEVKENYPELSENFSIEAWIALGAYPTFLCPIVDQQRDINDGYFKGYLFGIDAMGRLTLRIATNGRYEMLIGEETIPLNTWTHVACVYSVDDGMKIFLNGELAGSFAPKSKYESIDYKNEWHRINLIIGKSRAKSRPYGTIRPEGTQFVHSYIDGILDELKFYNVALGGKDLNKSFSIGTTDSKPELPERKLPSGPKGPGEFGAVSGTLKYYPA